MGQALVVLSAPLRSKHLPAVLLRSVDRDRISDTVLQRAMITGFFEKIDGPLLHRGDAGPYVAMAGNDDDREAVSGGSQVLQQVEAGHALHA